MRISDWSSDVCSSDLNAPAAGSPGAGSSDAGAVADGKAKAHASRVFLVVVDETEEMRVALRFAARRAHSTGGKVAMLYVVEPSEFQHWMSVGDLMREEARTEAEQVLQRSEEHTSELQSLMRISYAVFCLKKTTNEQI